ncbi:MAG TPA: hypothetical protein VLR26_18360 [Frankiaceae bacterium]|nr:hypothetical protein [Frankiaceae bacterium]
MERLHGCIEGWAANDVGPMLLDLGNAIPGSVEGASPALGGIDQLGAAVGRIRPSIQIPQALEVVDQLGGRSRAELRPRGELGQADAIDADVPKDLKVRKA